MTIRKQNDTHASDDLAPNGKPKVGVKLIGEDGNALAIIGRCRAAMRLAGWSAEEIEAFSNACTSQHNYDDLLATVLKYCYHTWKEEENEEDQEK